MELNLSIDTTDKSSYTFNNSTDFFLILSFRKISVANLSLVLLFKIYWTTSESKLPKVLTLFLILTKSILLIGEIGGSSEEEAAEFIKASKIKKPIVGFIAGKTAPAGKRMGHAGAIISGGKGKAENKIEKMKSCGILIAESPAEIGKTLHEKLAS